MDEHSSEDILDKRYRTTATVYLALIFSTVALVFAAFFYDGGTAAAADANSLMPLWVAVVFVAVATFVLRRVLNRWGRLKDAKLLKGFAGVFGVLQTNAVILGALAEAIAVIGFVIAAVGGNEFDAVRGAAVALIVFLMNFPRKSVWRKIAATLENV